MVTDPTRIGVLDAEARLFVDHGYAGVSMDQLRQAAGVSNGSLYHYLPTKPELADTLYVDTLRDFHAALLAPFGRDVNAEAGIDVRLRRGVSMRAITRCFTRSVWTVVPCAGHRQRQSSVHYQAPAASHCSVDTHNCIAAPSLFSDWN